MKREHAPALKGRKQKRLMQDCLILLVSLVLTEPRITPKQLKLIGGLIKRLRPLCADD